MENKDIKVDNVIAEIECHVLKSGDSWMWVEAVESRDGYQKARFMIRYAKKWYNDVEDGATYTVKVNIKLGVEHKTNEKRIEYWVIDLRKWNR